MADAPWWPSNAALAPEYRQMLDEFVARAGAVVLESTAGRTTETLAAICLEGEELVEGIHVLTAAQRAATLEKGVPVEQLWSPYGDWGWGGDAFSIEGGLLGQLATSEVLRRELALAAPPVDAGLHLNSLIGRFVTVRAPSRLSVTPEFVAYGYPYEYGTEVWQSLRIAADADLWSRLLAASLVDDVSVPLQ